MRDLEGFVYNVGVAAPSPPARPPGHPPGSAPPSEAGRLVDLYIVGGESADGNVQLKLATLIASRYRVAAPAVGRRPSGGALPGAPRPSGGGARQALGKA